MEAPLHHSPVKMPAPAPAPPRRQQQDAIAAAVLQHALAAVPTVTATQNPPLPPAQTAMAVGREQCPRCASRDTKFCYYNNYNTAQPRHFCRACRRYWTLGGSLRNVPVGGSTRKRPRPAPPTRALAAAVASSSAAMTPAASSCGPFSAPVSGGLLSSLLLGSAPLLQGRSDFDTTSLGQPADLAQLLWHTTALEGMFPPPPAAALWQDQDLAAAAPMDHAGGLLLLHQHRGAPPPLLP